MAAVMLATSCNKDEDNNASQQPEKKGIPFAIQVDMNKKLSKIGFDDVTTAVNISFDNKDENSLEMNIYSNTKTYMWDKTSYGKLTLTDKNGIFTGELSTMEGYPEDNETLLAIIRMNQAEVYQSNNESLEDLLNNCFHSFEGTFTFNAAKGDDHITNKSEQAGNQYYMPIYKFEDDFLPTVQLTDHMTYFEIILPTTTTSIHVSFNGGSSYTEEELKAGKIWIALMKDYVSSFSIQEINYTKSADEMDYGVIYTINRNNQN